MATLPSSSTLEMTQGDGRQVQLDFTLKASESAKAVPYAIVVGDHEVIFTIKKNLADADPGALQLRLTAGHMTIDSVVPSRVFVLIPSGVTATFEGTYWFDAKVIELATGSKKTARIGRITFGVGVTDA